MTAPSAQTTPRPRVAGSYEVLLELGCGGMGTTSVARAVGSDSPRGLVALKRFHHHLTSDPEVAKRLLEQTKAVRHLRHANLIGLLRAGADEAGHYLVLEYLEGDSVAALCGRTTLSHRGLPAPLALRVILDALAGLSALHDATDASGQPLGIVHCNLSTHSLLVGLDGCARVTGFGIPVNALGFSASDAQYVIDRRIYEPPEYLKRRQVDRRTDTYQMGLCLWIILAGRDPWSEFGEAQLIQAILTQGVPPLLQTGAQVAPEIAQVVDRACAADPNQRYGTAQEMAAALEQAGLATQGIATASEVAAWTERLVGADLARRRYLIETAGERDATATARVSAVVKPEAALRAARAGSKKLSLAWWAIVGALCLVVAVVTGILLFS